MTDLDTRAADVAVGGIASVGYEGRSVDDLLTALVAGGVSTLVDVRQNAISRKRGLSKRALGEACLARGIEYRHEPTLGNPKANRDGFRAGTAESVRYFEDHLVGGGGAALDRVAELLRDRTVALLCFEADPRCCHRSIVAAHLQRRAPTATVHAV